MKRGREELLGVLESRCGKENLMMIRKMQGRVLVVRIGLQLVHDGNEHSMLIISFPQNCKHTRGEVELTNPSIVVKKAHIHPFHALLAKPVDIDVWPEMATTRHYRGER